MQSLIPDSHSGQGISIARKTARYSVGRSNVGGAGKPDAPTSLALETLGELVTTANIRR